MFIRRRKVVFYMGLCFASYTLPALAVNPEVIVPYNNNNYVISYISTSSSNALLQNQIWYGNQSLAAQFSSLVKSQLGGVNPIIPPNFIFGPFFLYSNTPSATSSAWLTSLNANGQCSCDPGVYAYVVNVQSLVTLTSLSSSLMSTASVLDSSLASTDMLINGAHSRPLSRLVAENEKTTWIAGDWGRDDHGNHDGSVGVAEIGGGYNFGPAQINLMIGKTWAKQSLVYGGNVDADGQYVMVEGIIPISKVQGLYATVGTYGQWGSADISRGYLNGGLANISTASPDTHIWGLRARLDLENAFAMKSVEFSPYIDLSYSHSHMDGYTELGGGLPAQFNSRSEHGTEVHTGLNSAMPISTTTLNLVANLEANHRFNDTGASSSGQVIGLFSFSLPGQSYESTWLKGGVGVEGMLGKGKASVMLNGTTRSAMSNAWLAASYQLIF